MDFTLALTHFCEVHGPKSVLCTQVLPLECALCLPKTPPLKPKASFESYTTQVHDGEHAVRTQKGPRLKRSDTDFTLPPGLSQASTAVEDIVSNENIESHPLFLRMDTGQAVRSKFPFARAQGDTCASCSFSVPSKVTARLPQGAPGSLNEDGKSQNGAPVLRSREFVCLGRGKKRTTHPDIASSNGSKSSFGSFGSTGSHGACHDHTLTYLTAKSPEDAENYAQLRASVVRAFCCEQLPKGMSEGPFCYGNSETGYTITYVFRLTDMKARGRIRRYAFMALAGKDACRAFKACPMLWEAFATMAKTIEQAAHRYQEEQAQRERTSNSGLAGSSAYTPPSSFLTQRAVDPDGHPRRVGRIEPRSLAAIVGDDNIFAIMHQYFVAVLRCLGDKFGGIPLAQRRAVYQSIANESEGVASNLEKQMMDLKMSDDEDDDEDEEEEEEDDDTTTVNDGARAATDKQNTRTVNTQQAPKASTYPPTKHIKRSSQCAPINADKKSTSQQVIV